MYHRKYYDGSNGTISPLSTSTENRKDVGHTCDVQTLLNVTKANVCAIMLVARSFLARTNGIKTHDRESCGRNASDSMRSEDAPASAEARYSRTL